MPVTFATAPQMSAPIGVAAAVTNMYSDRTWARWESGEPTCTLVNSSVLPIETARPNAISRRKAT